MKKQKYPIGIQDFESLRKEGYLYIDKTQQIHEFISSGYFFLLTRPRRFGKSLLLSTVKYLFLGRKDLFKGLWIEDQWEWESNQHPVIHFSFSNINYHSLGLEKALEIEMGKIASQHGITLEAEDYVLRFREIIEKLGEKKVVILIDEYDKPIIDYIDDKSQAYTNRDLLKNFYVILKDADKYIRTLIITGVSRFSKVSIFSGPNNPNDLTLKNAAATLMGYTQEELERYFAHEVKAIAHAKEATPEALLAEIKRWYNGYSWDGKHFLYNPFSILSFFYDEGTFSNYWFATGTPTFLVKLLLEKGSYQFSRRRASATILDSDMMESVNDTSLMLQTGYLTIKERGEYGQLVLDIPNEEVRISLNRHLLAAFQYRNTADADELLFQLEDFFEAGDIESVIATLNSLFADIPYNIFLPEKEKFYHAVLHTAFTVLGLHLQSEVQTHRGRVDAVVETKDSVYLLEFKVNASALKALEQIKEREYHWKYTKSGKKIIAIGVNFSSDLRGVEGFEVEEF